MARKHPLTHAVQSMVDAPTLRKLEAAAAAQDVSVSCLVRRLIVENLVKQSSQQRKAA